MVIHPHRHPSLLAHQLSVHHHRASHHPLQLSLRAHPASHLHHLHSPQLRHVSALLHQPTLPLLRECRQRHLHTVQLHLNTVRLLRLSAHHLLPIALLRLECKDHLHRRPILPTLVLRRLTMLRPLGLLELLVQKTVTQHRRRGKGESDATKGSVWLCDFAGQDQLNCDCCNTIFM